MRPLRGVISDRLRRMFGADDPAWNPGRPADVQPKKGTKLPKGVQGESMTGRKRGKK